MSGIFIAEARIRNYRCLRSVDVQLDPLTILIGQNNSGKTSILEALFASIGFGQRGILNDDIYLAKSEITAPKDRPDVSASTTSTADRPSASVTGGWVRRRTDSTNAWISRW